MDNRLHDVYDTLANISPETLDALGPVLGTSDRAAAMYRLVALVPDLAAVHPERRDRDPGDAAREAYVVAAVWAALAGSPCASYRDFLARELVDAGIRS